MVRINRSPKQMGRFVEIANAVFEDRRLDWKTKGLLGYILTKLADWKVYISDLVKHGPEGEVAVRTGIDQLVE